MHTCCIIVIKHSSWQSDNLIVQRNIPTQIDHRKTAIGNQKTMSKRLSTLERIDNAVSSLISPVAHCIHEVINTSIVNALSATKLASKQYSAYAV